MLDVLTVGYGVRPVDELTHILCESDVTHLIDVRSSPYSNFNPTYDRPALQRALQNIGIKYIFMGDTLGGRPSDPACYEDGYVIYERVMKTENYLLGISALMDAIKAGHRCCILCSETKPEECHRSKMIGITLEDRGVSVRHIDESCVIVSQQSVMKRLSDAQSNLFGKVNRSRKQYGTRESK